MKKLLVILTIVAIALFSVPVIAQTDTTGGTLPPTWGYLHVKGIVQDTTRLSIAVGGALEIAPNIYGFISGEAGASAGGYLDVGYMFTPIKNVFIAPIVGIIDVTTPNNFSADPVWYMTNASGVLAGYNVKNGVWGFNAYAKYKSKLDGDAKFPQGWTFGGGVHFKLGKSK